MDENNFDLSQPPAGTDSNDQKPSGKGDGAAYINAGANALDSVMGAISFFATGQNPQQPITPTPPSPTKPPLTQQPVFIGGVVVLVLIVIAMLVFASRKSALPALPA